MTRYEEIKASSTAVESSEVAPKTTYDYPLNSPLLDLATIDPAHIQQLLANEIRFTISSRLHYLYVSDSGLRKGVQEGTDIDLQKWREPFQLCFPSVAALELYFIPHPGHNTFTLSRATLTSLLETASAPPSLVEALSNNNGLCSSSQFNDETTGETRTVSLIVRIPLGPFINGAFYLSHNVISNQTIAIIFFDGKLVKRLEVALEPRGGKRTDPFLSLSLLVSESCKIIEHSRSFIDKEVQLRESSTGATMVASFSRNKAPIELYPPLFNKLHSTQQQLLYMEGCVRFQVRLIRFLQAQHEALTTLRLSQLSEEGVSIRVNAQKVANSFEMSLSVMENMLEQVQTLSLRISIQLRIVESRLNQSNGRTQVSIAEETKRDSMAMKTIAALTMLFLPGTFTATFFSMPFFVADPNANSGLNVGRLLWVYFAVTVPLTVLVVMGWLAWLRYLEMVSFKQSSSKKSS